MNVAIVGAGYMGTNHARVLNQIRLEGEYDVNLSYIVDKDYLRAKRVTRIYGGKPLKDVNSLPSSDVDIAIVASPTSTHFNVVNTLIDKGIPFIFIEKPLTKEISEAERLVERAVEQEITLGVGHIERFNPAIISLMQELVSNKLGNILTIVSRRVGPFVPRVKDVDVIMDLAIHEVDIHLAIMRDKPFLIKSFLLERIVSDYIDHSIIVLKYKSGFSSIEVNRVTPFKQRLLYLTGTKGVAKVDYILRELIFYVGNYIVNTNMEKKEPLYLEDLAFIRSITEKLSPPVDAFQAYTSMAVCYKSIVSGKREKDELFSSDINQEFVEKGIRGYRSFYEYHLQWLRSKIQPW